MGHFTVKSPRLIELKLSLFYRAIMKIILARKLEIKPIKQIRVRKAIVSPSRYDVTLPDLPQMNKQTINKRKL